MEEWRAIENFPNYEVSNTGKVRSLNYNHTGRPKELKQGKSASGYFQVMLWKDRKHHYNKTVHRLVAEAFLSNPQNYAQVNHKDENKLNNIVENLEWCSAKYNYSYGTRGARISVSLTDNPHFSKPVYQLDTQGNIINEFPSIASAARAMHGYPTIIWKVCSGYTRKNMAYGYRWRFKNS